MANGGGGERDPTPTLSSSEAVVANKTTEDTRSIKRSTRYGEPAIVFQPCDVDQGSIRFKNALIGKFSSNSTVASQSQQPGIDAIRRYIKDTWQMVGDCRPSLMDSRHVLFNFSHRQDMVKIWLKESEQHNNGLLLFGGFSMKLFKWSPMFRPSLHHDPSIVPAWISLPNLPLFCYEDRNLRSVASLIGEVLAVDDDTQNCTRLDRARICVVLDLEQSRPSRVWIAVGSADEGFWQLVMYDQLPTFCSQCRKQGHSIEKCRSDLITETEPPAGTGLQPEAPQVKNELVTEHKHECWSNLQSGKHDQVVGSYRMVNGGGNLLYDQGGNTASSHMTTASHTHSQIHGFNIFGCSAMAAVPAGSSFYKDNAQVSGISNQQNSLIPREGVTDAPGTGKKCERCLATKTPSWRRGPEGRMTLCNACGLRYKREPGKALGIRDSGRRCKGDSKENKISKNLALIKLEEKVLHW